MYLTLSFHTLKHLKLVAHSLTDRDRTDVAFHNREDTHGLTTDPCTTHKIIGWLAFDIQTALSFMKNLIIQAY